MLYDVASGSTRQLFVSHDGRRFSPSFSIATQRIAVTHYLKDHERESYRPEILLISLDGEPPARLSSFNSSQDYVKNAVFSPDGRRLAVEKGYNQEINPDVYIYQVMDWIEDELAWSSLTAWITNPDHIGIHTPRFSPDGKRLVYLGNYASSDALEVCVTDLTISEESEEMFGQSFGPFYQRRLTHNADVVWHRPAALALEPRSDTAFFIRGHYRHEYEQICTVLCSADAKQDPYTTRSVTELFEHIGGIYLSPDGKQFAFNGDERPYIAALDGGDFLQLTDDGDGACTCMAFSPDSRYIAFARRHGAKAAGIWLTDRFGEADENLLISVRDGSVKELLWV